MKLVLVQHPRTEAYRLPFLKHRNLLTLRSGPGTRNEVQNRTPRKVLEGWISVVKIKVSTFEVAKINCGCWPDTMVFIQAKHIK